MTTGLVRWEWHSLDHVDVNESETSPPESTPVGLVPPELDRSAARRERLHLGAQHLGRLPDPGRQRHHPLASRRPEELVQDGPGHPDRVAARRSHPPRRGRHPVRRRLRPARALPVARRADRARLQDAYGAHCARRTRTPVRRSWPRARATRRRWPAGPPSSAGAGCRRSASTRGTARCSSTPTCPST